MREPRHPSELWRWALEESELSQAEVARRMGVSHKHLNQILNGHVGPSATMTVRFARATGTSARLLWGAQADHLLADAIREVGDD